MMEDSMRLFLEDKIYLICSCTDGKEPADEKDGTYERGDPSSAWARLDPEGQASS